MGNSRKDILGDGIILEIPGYIIDILKPRTHQYIPLKTIKDKPFQFQANIVMMCGCVIDKGGVWDSEEIDVKGILKRREVYEGYQNGMGVNKPFRRRRYD